MIVTRFTFFTENFVICCYQVTKVFRSRHDCTSAFSARSPCNLVSQADIAISVLREVSKNAGAYPIPLLLAALKTIDEKELEASRCSGTLSSTRPCLNSYCDSGRSCDKFPCTSTFSSFLHGFSVSSGSCDSFPCGSSLILSLLVAAGCSRWVTVSCDEDVEVGEDEVEEVVDRPGTTKGT